MNNDICAIVLAAGIGSRMNSELPKVLHEICGKTLLSHVLTSLEEAGIADTAVVTGYKAQMVEEKTAAEFPGVSFCRQNEYLGTAHAVMSAAGFLQGRGGKVIVLCGDAPLISADMLRTLADFDAGSSSAMSVLTAELDNPAMYGRIVRENGVFSSVTEFRDCSDEQKLIREVNSGIYIFDTEKLLDVLPEIGCSNAKNEYYLTDAAGLFISKGYGADACLCEKSSAVMAANDRAELAECAKIMRDELNMKHMMNGVTIVDPQNTYISRDAVIGRDTVIWPNTIISGRTLIGESNTIYSSRIESCIIGSGNEIDSCVLEYSEIGDGSSVGPYAHFRAGTSLGNSCRIGNFVEIKNSAVGSGTKAAHLTYIGDASVGERVNFGCGVVTANYDGVSKNMTVIEDDAFIGCNVNLIAPVRIGKHSFIGAGSTITRDVEDNALAVERGRVTVKKDYKKE